jgi:hypothetical protein
LVDVFEEDPLVEAAALGFANVIDAFHISRGGEPTETRFFVNERASRHRADCPVRLDSWSGTSGANWWRRLRSMT